MTQRSVEASGNTVVAVRHGEWRTLRSNVFLNYVDRGEADGPHTVAYFFWVITTPRRTILVDSGFATAAAQRRGREVLIPSVDAFVALGLDRDADIDLVLTHGHYDHIGNANWFRRATVYMARAEYEFWHSPEASDPDSQGLVEPAEIAYLDEIRANGRLRLLDDERELAPGVEILLAPGHTPGELLVRVVTDDGAVLLTSDAVHFDEELARDMPFRHMCDLDATQTSYRLIRELVRSGRVDHVIAGHETTVSTRFAPMSGALSAHAVVVGNELAAAALTTKTKREVSSDH